MMTAILKSYLSLLLSVGVGALGLFLLGLFFILKLSAKSKPQPVKNDETFAVHAHDLSAIAGEDLMSTQLDLARAYIETDKKELAKMILRQVISSGSAFQQKEAQRLLDFI